MAVKGLDFGKRSPHNDFPPAQQGGVVADALHFGQIEILKSGETTAKPLAKRAWIFSKPRCTAT